MSHRRLALKGAVAAVIAVVSLALVPLAAQAPTWTQTRTPWGDPDLQGIWANKVTTPLERPDAFAGKRTLTGDELAELEEQAVLSQVDRAPTEGNTGTYNQHWFDRTGKRIERTSLIIDPPDGRVPPLTAEAQKREAARAEARRARGPADGPEDRSLWERCITRTLPRFPGGYNAHMQIVQSPGYVVIENEMVHEARIIPTDGRPHFPPHIRLLHGDPRGRWEGNTLVIDTTNFTDKTNFRGSGAGLHLIERLTRTDANTISYEITVDDPTTFTRSWKAEFPIQRPLDEVPQMYEYACHEGNYGLEGQLSSARAEDKAAEAAKNGSK